MKRYCFDTSGISNPLETMPEDIHASLWTKVIEIFEDGSVAVTAEISQEMTNIPGLIGKCVNANKDQLVLEVNAVDWDWQKYVTCSNELIATHRAFISEYTGGSPKTVDLIDMSIIALAKALGLPLVSMEKLITAPGAQKKRIPNICQHEGIEHLDFNDFLRREKLTF
jgi:hypothetical protein